MGKPKSKEGRDESPNASRLTSGLTAEVSTFYADIKAGTVGEVVRSWQNYSGKWYKLYLGTNLSGKKLYKRFPHSVIKIL